jgi:exopolysaccharide biosynthesis polyprenyl glycosylphosphotransferase
MREGNQDREERVALIAGEMRPRTASVRLARTRRGFIYRRVLLVSDLLALVAAYGALAVVSALAGRSPFSLEEYVLSALLVPVWVLLAHAVGLYHLSERRVDHSLADELSPVLVATTVWAWFLLLGSAALTSGPVQLLAPIVLWAATIVFVLCLRQVVLLLVRNRTWFRQPVVVIGDRDDLDRVLPRILRHPESGLDPVGMVCISASGFSVEPLDGVGRGPAESRRFEWNGASHPAPDRLAEVIRDSDVGRAIVAGWPESLAQRTDLVRGLTNSGICVDLVAGEPEALFSTAVLHHVEGLPMLTVQAAPMTRTSQVLKRVFDVVIAGTSLLVMTPFFAYVAIRIKLDSSGPVLFRQLRAGLDGRPFEMLKFRTMVEGADSMRSELRRRSIADNGHDGMFKIRDDPRITRFGARLRRWSLDELPQLWNVLRGDMSVIGPRPLPLDEARLAEDRLPARLSVRPGITGPWQVNGRSDIPFEDMVQLDYTYVTAWTMREDLRLLLRTVGSVLNHRGAY